MRLFEKLRGLTGWLRDAAVQTSLDDSVSPLAPHADGFGSGARRLTEAVERDVAAVVSEARYGHLSIQSNYARLRAPEVAAAAVLGLITTETPEGFGRVWRVTSKGIQWLETEVEL